MSDDGKNGLRLAVLGALADTIDQEQVRIRGEGADMWRGLKEQGFPHQKITLPDGGPPVGMLLFNGGTEHVDVDPAAVLAYVKAHEPPRCLEEVVDRSALTDPEVIALLKEHRPELVTQRVRPGTADRLIKEAKANSGRIMHPDGLDCTTVGTVTTSKIEGKVTWRPGKEATSRIMAALKYGSIGDLGLWPLQVGATVTSGPVTGAIVQAVPETAEPSRQPDLHLGGDVYHQVTFDDLDSGLEAGTTDAALPDPEFFADKDGFLDPVKAAAHAVIVQGGFTDPQREAYRMIRDGGVAKERALAWLRATGLPEDPPASYAA